MTVSIPSLPFRYRHLSLPFFLWQTADFIPCFIPARSRLNRPCLVILPFRFLLGETLVTPFLCFSRSTNAVPSCLHLISPPFRAQCDGIWQENPQVSIPIVSLASRPAPFASVRSCVGVFFFFFQVTLRSYLGMLRMVDDLRSQESYRRASALLVRAYLRLHDQRPGIAGGGGGAGLPDMTNMTAAEKKRVKAKVSVPAYTVFVRFFFVAKFRGFWWPRRRKRGSRRSLVCLLFCCL